MPLRVLLADESTTIKKAIQMVLSDYGVDVKMVPTGIDVYSVTQSYKPDIILADVLLTKKNGYEVCAEIKNSPDTSDTPVILMWSSFMQLDQNQFQLCKANASLEKPFDTLTVRKMVEGLVPKLNTFPLKGFMNHPKLPEFEESETYVRQKSNYTMQSFQSTQEEPSADVATSDFNIPQNNIPEIPELPSEDANPFQLEDSPAAPDEFQFSGQLEGDGFSLESPDGIQLDGEIEIPGISSQEEELIEVPLVPKEKTAVKAVPTPEVSENSVSKKQPLPPSVAREKAPPVATKTKQAPVPTQSVKKTVESDDADQFSRANLTQSGATSAGSPKPTGESESWSGSKSHQYVIETESFGDFEEVKVISSRGAQNETPDLQKRINEQIQNYLKDSPVATHKAQAALQQQQRPTSYSSFDEQLMREEIRQIAERICWQIIPEVTEKLVREELNKLLQGIENNI